jgi:hypothetical protein
MVGTLRCNDCGLALDDSPQIQNDVHHQLFQMRSNVRWPWNLYILRYGQRRNYLV